jgi:hypothetical protein
MRRSKDARQQHQRQRTTASMPMLGMRAHHAALGLDEGAQDEPVAVLYCAMRRTLIVHFSLSTILVEREAKSIR